MTNNLIKLLDRFAMFLQRKDASFGAVPVMKKGKEYQFLIIQHQAGHWGFPKGHPEKEETELQTAMRELNEETGLTHFRMSSEVSFEEVYHFYLWRKRITKTVKYFIAFIEKPEVQLQEEEIADSRWVKLAEAEKLISFEPARKILRDVHQYLSTQDKE
jgi:bis(5'-nucleosidyl)-tetraphosphatase